MPLPRLIPALPVLLALLAVPAAARDPVMLAGPAPGQEVVLPLDALRALPAETREVAFLTSKGEEKARYTGTRLWDLLAGRGFVDPANHPALLRTLVVVTAGDGYTLVLAAADLAPELGDTPVLLAYAREGEALAADRLPRLIVPGDRRGARNVFDIARISVRVLDPIPQEKTP